MTNTTASARNGNLKAAAISAAADAPPELQEIYNALERKALDALSWYEAGRRPKKRGARVTRGLAIVLGALTTIIPSAIALCPEKISWWIFDEFPVVKLNPVATVAGVLAATMILLDKFYGFSSSWMRYLTTYQTIQSVLEDVGFEWRKQILRLKSNQPPTDEQIIAVYESLEAFLKSVNDAVRSETQSWVTEFKGALAEIDKSVEEQKAAAAKVASSAAKGGINVNMTYFAQLDGRRWTLQLDNRREEVKEGQATAAIPQLEPGVYRVRVGGAVHEQRVAAEYAVEVKAGEIFNLSVDIGKA